MKIPLLAFSHFLRHPRHVHYYIRGPNVSTSFHACFSSMPDSSAFTYGDYTIIFPSEPVQMGTSHMKILPVPASVPRPQYVIERQRRIDAGESDVEINEAGDLDPDHGDGRIKLGGEEEARLRRTARLAKKVREFARSLVKVCSSPYVTFLYLSINRDEVGVTTNAIDLAIHNFIIAHDAYPSPRLYSGFPRSCCTSVNNIIAHGIPDEYAHIFASIFLSFQQHLLQFKWCLTIFCSRRPLENGDIVNIDITVFRDGYHGDTSKTFLVGDGVVCEHFLPIRISQTPFFRLLLVFDALF